MAKANRFIEGIFNYCDRWCERCHMTQYCSVYEVEQAIDAAAPGEVETEDFWNQLDERLAVEVEDAGGWADDFLGVEPPTEEEIEEFRQEQEWRDKLAYSTDVSQAAKTYLGEVMRWLGEHKSLRRGSPERERALKVDRLALADAVDVVGWYHTLVAAKIHRALSGQQERDWNEDALQSDWNGSAKVALLGLERSIGAWSLIRDHLPEEEAQIRRLLAHCGRVRRLVLEQFPDAREFVRPGFDDR